MAGLVTLNTDDSEHELKCDMGFGALEAVKWLAEKYGVGASKVTVEMLLTHTVVMSWFADMGIPMNDPARTDGDTYDRTRDELTSYVLVQTVD